MTHDLTPDICVIGGGAGGMTVATAAAAFGVPVVLIEKDAIGGLNDNDGNIAPAALFAASERAAVLRGAPRFGFATARCGVDLAAIGARVREVVDAAAADDRRERFAALGIRIVAGQARFQDADTVTVDDVAIRARRYVIATGAAPAVPALPGLADTPHFTSASLLDLAVCPRHLIVIGAGSTGLAYAQAFRRFGAAVTVLETAVPLAGDDAECAAIVLDALERDGIVLRAGIDIRAVRRVLARIEIDIVSAAGAETVTGSHLLVAAGHRPKVEDLDLDAAGVRYGPRGIVVDKALRTSNRRVYAVGDVTVGQKATHLAQYQAELVVRHALFRQRVAVDRRVVPAVTYTNPQLAQVGFLEDEARGHAGTIRVLRWPYRANGRALAERATNGHIKIITDRHGTILGATIVGPEASESITPFALAVGQRLNIEAFAGLVAPFPTYGDVGKRAAMAYFMRGLTSSRVRRIIGRLRRSG